MTQPLPVRTVTMPTPYAVGPVNAYLVEAQPLTLVDAGINTPEAQNALVLALTAAGYFVESVERILITHAHPDHYGLVPFLQEVSGATVYFPEREIARVRDRQMLFEVGRLLMEAGMPLELLFKMDQQRKKDPAPRVPHEEVVPVTDGDTFSFTTGDGSFELQALLMPGHTGGHVVYFEPETRTMFAGDQLLPDVSPNPCWNLRSTSRGSAAGRWRSTSGRWRGWRRWRSRSRTRVTAPPSPSRRASSSRRSSTT
ncbi:MAG: MBL fold metallo-hydrolase [Actinomycetota bacterium]|nr:MBL fold metallo-hydrolase [Actinomycetota bacterium]